MDCAVPVLYEDDSLIACVKSAGLPTAPIHPYDDCLLYQVAEHCPAVLEVKGKKEIEGGLLHRIDTATTGLVLLAKTQRAYDFLASEQECGRFIKQYTACCYKSEPLFGVAESVPCVVQSAFRPFGEKSRGVKPVFSESGRSDRKKAGSRLYSTRIMTITPVSEPSAVLPLFTVIAEISAGYRHQVRSHLAAIGFPVLGDPLYPSIWNVPGHESDCTDSKLPLYFFASGISASHPETGATLTVQLPESFLLPLPDKNCQ